MSATELRFWELKYQTEPLGRKREDYRIARLEAAIINWAGRSLKDGIENVKPLDLMPFAETTSEEIEVDEQARKENLDTKIDLWFSYWEASDIYKGLE